MTPAQKRDLKCAMERVEKMEVSNPKIEDVIFCKTIAIGALMLFNDNLRSPVFRELAEEAVAVHRHLDPERIQDGAESH